MIKEMDEVIQSFCTKFSHWLQRATGLTCYFVARIGVSLTALGVIALIINYFFPFLPERSDLLTLVLSVWILWSCVRQSIACQRGEESVGSNTKPTELISYTGLRSMPFWRLLWIGLSIYCLGTVSWLSHPVTSFVQDEAFPLGCAIFYNFVSVTPLPPGTSKLRQWIRGFFTAPPELARQEN